MSSLPDPTKFKDHKADYIASSPKETEKSYDLEKIHKQCREDIQRADRQTIRKQSNDLVCYEFFKTAPFQEAVKGLFGFSSRDNSITIHLEDNGEVKTVAVRRSGEVKWKTYGSKKFIPYQIEDDFVFIFSGMAELAIVKILGLSYVMLQADGMVKHLPEELKELCRDKTIIVLQDNDDSFKAIVPKIKEFFSRSEVLVIDFERILDRELKYGYDFRDFVNDIKDAEKVMERLEIEIICLQDKSYVR